MNSFNERTGLRRVWGTYKGLPGKTKVCNTGSHLALRLGVSEEDIVNECGSFFFLQQSMPTRNEIYAPVWANVEKTENAPFTLAELIEALESAKNNTAPGPEDIFITALRNLPTENMKWLMQMYNDALHCARSRPTGKKSTDLPIPKPAKPSTSV